MTLNESQAAPSALETFKTHRIRLHIQGLKACDTAEFGVGMNVKSTQVWTPTQTAPAMGRSRVFRWSASGDRALDPFTRVVRQQAPGSEMWTRICPQPWNGQSRRGPQLRLPGVLPRSQSERPAPPEPRRQLERAPPQARRRLKAGRHAPASAGPQPCRVSAPPRAAESLFPVGRSPGRPPAPAAPLPTHRPPTQRPRGRPEQGEPGCGAEAGQTGCATWEWRFRPPGGVNDRTGRGGAFRLSFGRGRQDHSEKGGAKVRMAKSHQLSLGRGRVLGGMGGAPRAVT